MKIFKVYYSLGKQEREDRYVNYYFTTAVDEEMATKVIFDKLRPLGIEYDLEIIRVEEMRPVLPWLP